MGFATGGEVGFQVLFGDDEHTAADGPYARLMKTRKWLYLSAASAVLLTKGLYDEVAAKGLVRVVELPASLVAFAIATGLAYLILQYALLVQQLWVTYDIVLKERLAFRRADELARASERVVEARRSVDAHINEVAKTEGREAAEAQNAVEIARKTLANAQSLKGMTVSLGLDQGQEDLAIKTAERALSDAMAKAEQKRHEIRVRHASSTVGIAPGDSVGHALMEEWKGAMKQAEALAHDNPARRRGYRRAEKVIDVMRIGVPLVFGVVALACLIEAHPFEAARETAPPRAQASR